MRFTLRFSNAEISEYFARASPPLRSDNITVVGGGMPFGAMQVLAVHSATSPSIFDQDPSNPASCTYGSCGDCRADQLSPGLCALSVRTSMPDFMFAAVAINDAPSCGGGTGGGVQGFTTLVHSGQGTFSSIFEIDYRFSNTSGTSIVFGCTGTDVKSILMEGISLDFGS